MILLRFAVLSIVVLLASSKKNGNVDSETVEELKELLLTSMQSIVSLDKLVTDLSDKVARLTTAMSDTELDVKILKSSVLNSLQELTNSLTSTKEDVELTKQDVQDLQKSGNMTKQDVQDLQKNGNMTVNSLQKLTTSLTSTKEDVEMTKQDVQDLQKSGNMTKQDVQDLQKSGNMTVNSLQELTNSLTSTKEDVELMNQDVQDLQKSGNLTKITEQVQQLTASLAETEAKVTNIGKEVTVVSGEEGKGDPKCVKVCAGTTGRDSTKWNDYSSYGLHLKVDIGECGFVKVPTVTTTLEGSSNHWKATGTSAVYSTTTKGFTMYLESSDHAGYNPKNGKAAAWRWNVEWIAVGYTC